MLAPHGAWVTEAKAQGSNVLPPNGRWVTEANTITESVLVLMTVSLMTVTKSVMTNSEKCHVMVI